MSAYPIDTESGVFLRPSGRERATSDSGSPRGLHSPVVGDGVHSGGHVGPDDDVGSHHDTDETVGGGRSVGGDYDDGVSGASLAAASGLQSLGGSLGMPHVVSHSRVDRLLLQRLKRSSSSNQMLLWADAASQAGASDAPPAAAAGGGGRRCI
mmetsp:Transcript_8207/g.24469  ORF Transcript_8207/g.24469 Transcript_8207/m.24469 type:complete len:153 (+) Transcript_8207:807-1265(+)